MSRKMLVALAITAGFVAAGPGHADINIGINISPPPAVVVASPPHVVAVPGSPVLYAPAGSYNLFVYGGRYYSFHNGAWFVAVGQGGAWTIIATNQVPQPVLAVPATYYRVPPGQAKKVDVDRPGQRGGCPPGLAKKGRC